MKPEYELWSKGLVQVGDINERIKIVRFRGIKRELITYPHYRLIGVHKGKKGLLQITLK